MKPATLIACLCLAAPASLAAAQPSNPGSQTQPAAEPVNAMCRIGKEPIVPSAGSVVYKGSTIGICCPGCGEEFLAWDEARKDEFVALAAAGREPGMEHTDHGKPSGDGPAPDPIVWTAPYPLGTCPISGQKLGSMGDPIVKKYNGREVRLCCGGCVGKFEADPDAAWKKIDESIIKDQLPYYAMQTCVVSGEPLFKDGKDIANNFVYGNRLIRLCCTMCERKFTADPMKFIATLDKAAADAQRADYPLDTCIVAGSKLGSMGEPAEMVVAGRLMRLCCAGCESTVNSDPAKFITTIDAAWQTKGGVKPSVQPDGDGGDSHDHDHGG